mmetsp:Transcript_864/g.2793  ORF Transcript_864/g.2793 Transcript_864/m.2793 type:complete len:215 (+) Transcript_864:552-1196(+)
MHAAQLLAAHGGLVAAFQFAAHAPPVGSAVQCAAGSHFLAAFDTALAASTMPDAEASGGLGRLAAAVVLTSAAAPVGRAQGRSTDGGLVAVWQAAALPASVSRTEELVSRASGAPWMGATTASAMSNAVLGGTLGALGAPCVLTLPCTHVARAVRRTLACRLVAIGHAANLGARCCQRRAWIHRAGQAKGGGQQLGSRHWHRLGGGSCPVSWRQ